MIRIVSSTEATRRLSASSLAHLIPNLGTLRACLFFAATLFVLTPFASRSFVLCPSYDGVCTQLQDPPGSNPSDCTGVPVHWVSEPNLQLRLEDEPLRSYAPGLGPRPLYRLSYRNRGAPPEENGYFSFGINWSCSFRAYVIDLGSSIVRMHRGGAGFVDYTNGVPHFLEGSVMHTLSTYASYELDLPDGGKQLFQASYTNGSGVVLVFLSQQVDPQGNAVTYNYSTDGGIFRLTSVVDADGHTNSLYYENGSFPNQVTKVVDPFLRTNLITYNDLGYITNLTDSQGLSTSFQYDSGAHVGWLTNMITPYGTNSFRFGGTDMDNEDYLNTDHQVNRFVEITLPTGSKELYVYRTNCDDFIPQHYGSVPSTSPFSNTLDDQDQYHRNSFHWGPLQYAGLSTTDPTMLSTNDYAIGRLRHWLLNPTTLQPLPLPALSLERSPSQDGSTPGQLVWYDYPSKSSGNNYSGSSGLNSLKARVLPDGTARFERLIRNSFGKVRGCQEVS